MDTIEEVEFDYEAYTRENPPDLSKARPGLEVRRERREAFKARLINHINMEIKHAREMRHVFISYCHENKTIVDRLCQALASHDIHIWLDRDNIGPGTPWKQSIQQAIQHGDFFIACFSTEKRFKKFARLISVLYLKLSNTVEDILQLDMELLNSVELHVKFIGRRSQSDVNEEPVFLEFEGVCPLSE